MSSTLARWSLMPARVFSPLPLKALALAAALVVNIVFATQVVGLELTTAQLDTAMEQASTTLEESDPTREPLLKSYRDTRALLLELDKYEEQLEVFREARANAFEQAQSIRQELAQAMAESAKDPGGDAVERPLVELEQLIQVDKSDLAALERRSNDISDSRGAEQNRPAEVRNRLTEIGSLLPEADERVQLMNTAVATGSQEEARLWLAQAQLAVYEAEKAALDEELLSQPVRLELLSAQQERITQEISVLKAHLLAMDRRASELRQGQAEQALAEAESAKEEASGKHPRVQALADENAALSASVTERSSELDEIRGRELALRERAEQFERDYKTIERKLEILGMTKTVGEILREQNARLPSSRSADQDVQEIAELIAGSSLRQLELEDARDQLNPIPDFIVARTRGEPPAVVDAISADLHALALSRSELLTSAIDIENTYARAVGELDVVVHRFADVVEDYRRFISERMLWAQSRDPLSWSLVTTLPGQAVEMFQPAQWLAVLQWVVLDAVHHPVLLIGYLLVVVLLYLTPRLNRALVATGHSVGFVRTDAFAATFKGLLLSLLSMLKWPLLMLVLAGSVLFYEPPTIFSSAVQSSLARTAMYFLGLEFIRCLLYPRGLVEAHFRWPAKRVASLARRVRRFEQTFLPSVFIAMMSIRLYPAEVGGSIGTLAVVAMLLSMAYFFYRMPHFVQDKVDSIFSESAARPHTFWGRMIRALLAWVPIVLIVAVLFGYTFTAIEFSMLLIQTVVLFTGLMLLHEFGMRWLRLTRRRLRLKVQQDLALAAADEADVLSEKDNKEHDPDVLDDEGTKFLNALLLLGGVLGLVVVWSDVIPALGILNSIELWHHSTVVDGQETLVPITLASLFGAVIVGVAGVIAARRLPSLLEILLRQKIDVTPGSAYAIATVVQYTLTTVAVLSVLSILGGSWSQIQWAVAALSVGIGFGLQEIVANFISGLIILFEQPIRVGDTVTVGETSGVVTRIRMRATTIRDWDRRELLVPNKEFVTGRLLNWSLSDQVTRLLLQVGVAYGTDMTLAMKRVEEAAREHPLVLDEPSPFVTFDEFGDNSLLISLRCYLGDVDKRLSTASAIRLSINDKLAEADISIAFPQRDLHIDSSSPLDVRVLDNGPDR